jgi:3-oxoacyl-[acyl-carrier protein] reductase
VSSLAQEVSGFGITVNALLPGDVDTPMKQWALHLESDITGTPYPEIVEALSEHIPLGRLAEPAEVAHLVTFLASDEARFITGQAYIVSGGREVS